MRSKFYFAILLAILASIVGSCGLIPDTETVMLITPSATPTWNPLTPTIEPSLTRAATRTPTVTPTPYPTVTPFATRVPSSTPGPSPTSKPIFTKTPGPSPTTEPSPTPSPIEVGFPTVDNTPLVAALYNAGNRIVILAHQRNGDRTKWDGFARVLQKNRYSVLSLDFRGYGGSGGTADFNRMDSDILAAVTFARQQLHADRIAIIGASMGGTYATAALGDPLVKGVALLSSPAKVENFSVSLSALQLPDPLKYFIGCEADALYMAALTDMFKQSIAKQDKLHPVRAELVSLKCAAHGLEIFNGPQQERLTALLMGFVQAALQ